MIDTRVDVIRRLARRGAGSALSRSLGKIRPEDIAVAISHLAPAEQRLVFSHIEDDAVAADVLARVEESDLHRLVRDLDFKRLVTLLEDMEVDDEADVIARLPSDLRERVLEAITKSDKEAVEDILAWPEDSAGGIMQPVAFRTTADQTCRDAINQLHEQTADLEMVFYLYVENDAEQLVGVCSLRDLLTHPPSTPLSEIMTKEVITVAPETDQEEVARIVSRYDLLAVPVVDDQRHLLGIVTVDDVVDVIKEEAIEDMMLMAGVGDSLEANVRSPLRAARTRVRFLLITLATGVMISQIIGHFDDALHRNIVLAGFMPVVMGMGGNVGSQASTIMVRNLALGQVTLEDGPASHLWREGRVGILLGAFFGLLLATFIQIRYGNWYVSLAIGASIELALVNAACMGTIIPLVLQRLRIDPAVATGPFASTSIDLITVLIYFNVATHLFGL